MDWIAKVIKHIIKNIILLIICCAEIGEPIKTIIITALISYHKNPQYEILHYPKFNRAVSLTSCKFKQTLMEINTE